MTRWQFRFPQLLADDVADIEIAGWAASSTLRNMKASHHSNLRHVVGTWAKANVGLARCIIAALHIVLAASWIHAGAAFYESTHLDWSLSQYLVLTVVTALAAVHSSLYAFSFDARGRRWLSHVAVVAPTCVATAALTALVLAWPSDVPDQVQVQPKLQWEQQASVFGVVGALATPEQKSWLSQLMHATSGRQLTRRAHKRMKRVLRTPGGAPANNAPIPTAMLIVLLVLLTGFAGAGILALSCELSCAGKVVLGNAVLYVGLLGLAAIWFGTLRVNRRRWRAHRGQSEKPRRRPKRPLR